MIYFDICAVIILLMLVFSVFFRKMTVGLTNRLFMILIFVTLATAVSDIFSAVIPYGGRSAAVLRSAFQYLYLLLRNSMSPVYILYLISLTDTWHKLSKSLVFKLFLTVPYLTIIAALVSNFFTGAVFSFDENGVYTRGSVMPVLYVCSFIYLVTGIGYIIIYKNLFKAEKLLSLCAIFPPRRTFPPACRGIPTVLPARRP